MLFVALTALKNTLNKLNSKISSKIFSNLSYFHCIGVKAENRYLKTSADKNKAIYIACFLTYH